MIRDIDLWTEVESLKTPADLRFVHNDFAAFVGRFAGVCSFCRNLHIFT